MSRNTSPDPVRPTSMSCRRRSRSSEIETNIYQFITQQAYKDVMCLIHSVLEVNGRYLVIVQSGCTLRKFISLMYSAYGNCSNNRDFSSSLHRDGSEVHLKLFSSTYRRDVLVIGLNYFQMVAVHQYFSEDRLPLV
jgi:hypothetical protein